MGTTKRTPLARNLRRRITPEAVAAFARMQAVVCTCAEVDWAGNYWDNTRCRGCDEWWAAHSVLHRELKAGEGSWPCVEDPDELCPYPTGSAAMDGWIRDRGKRPEAFDLFRYLTAMVAEAK